MESPVNAAAHVGPGSLCCSEASKLGKTGSRIDRLKWSYQHGWGILMLIRDCRGVRVCMPSHPMRSRARSNSARDTHQTFFFHPAAAQRLPGAPSRQRPGAQGLSAHAEIISVILLKPARVPSWQPKDLTLLYLAGFRRPCCIAPPQLSGKSTQACSLSSSHLQVACSDSSWTNSSGLLQGSE